jgi:hypothetical protein
MAETVFPGSHGRCSKLTLVKSGGLVETGRSAAYRSWEVARSRRPQGQGYVSGPGALPVKMLWRSSSMMSL